MTTALILTFSRTPTSDVGAGKEQQSYVSFFSDVGPANPVMRIFKKAECRCYSPKQKSILKGSRNNAPYSIVPAGTNH